MREFYRKTMMLLLMFVLAFSVATVSGVSANSDESHIHVLKEPDFSTYGANPPGSNASTHDLSISNYNYQVRSVGYRVFTDKWLTGASSMKVTVENWELIEEYGGTNDKITISVCQSGFWGDTCTSKVITGLRKGGSDYVTFSNLDSSTKYYVRFEVPTNSNRYKFNGTISKS